MRLSLCEGIAAVQVTLALGALALGQPAIAGVFAIFAAVQLIGVVAGQRCADGSCETRLVAPEVAPGRARERG